MSGFSQYVARQQDENITERKTYKVCLCWSQDTLPKTVVSWATEMCWDSPVQGALPACFFPGLRVLWGARHIPFVGGKCALLAELAWDPSCPWSIFLADETGGWWLGRSEGWLNPAQEGYYPLAQLQISGFWKQMVPSANQIEEGRFTGEASTTYLLCQQMDKLSTYYPATRYTLNYLCLKFQPGMVIWV